MPTLSSRPSTAFGRSKSLPLGAVGLSSAAVIMLALVAPCRAADTAPPTGPFNVVSFSAAATAEVLRDQLTVTLQALRDGTDAVAVQTALKQAVEVALVEARRHAQPDALEVRSGSFNVSPRYGREGRISGWQGSADVVLVGRDIARVASTAGKLTGLNVTSSTFSVSQVLREQMEADLTAQAVQKFRRQAAALAQQFGFGGYVLREVQVQGVEAEVPRAPLLMMRSAAPMAAADAALPTEPGKGQLTATVQGSVMLTR